MRIKDLFTVPTNQKVTEKHLYRVLISSICSILLCMASLAGTTWAWFTVSIENTGNVIQIGEPMVELTVHQTGNPEADSTLSDGAFASGNLLEAGSYEVKLTNAGSVDDLNRKSTLYVTFTLREGETFVTGCTAFSESAVVTVETNAPCALSWEVSWFKPANAPELENGKLTFVKEEETEEISDESSVPDDSSEMSSDFADTAATTVPASEPINTPTDTSEPVEPTTAPIEELTEQTGEGTIPTEPDAPATETPVEETESSANGTEPGQE